MTITYIIASFFACLIIASAASLPTNHVPRQLDSECDHPVILDAGTNVFLDHSLHPSSAWRQLTLGAAKNIVDNDLKKRAMNASEQGTFVWIEKPDDIPRIEEAAQYVPCNHVLGLVLAGLPYKECLSNGTAPVADPWSYEDTFLKPIVSAIRSNPNVAFVVIVEPGVLGNVVTKSQNICEHVRRSWRQNVPLALKRLDLPNVVTYMDGAHGGWLGWKVPYPDNPQKAGAIEISNTWKAAGELKQFRGIAINVASYNSWDMSPGEAFEGENTCYDVENPARNEQRYLRIMQARIKELNVSMPTYGIMDTSRSGVFGLRYNWLDWCNVNSAGFGYSPSANTKDDRLDAYIWAKWGGLSDGTSDKTSIHYDIACSRADAYQPMPERGDFSQEYFEMLLRGWRPRRYGEGGWLRRDKAMKAQRCG